MSITKVYGSVIVEAGTKGKLVLWIDAMTMEDLKIEAGDQMLIRSDAKGHITFTKMPCSVQAGDIKLRWTSSVS